MSKEERPDRLDQDSDSTRPFCIGKDRLVKKLVAKVLGCEIFEEKREHMGQLSSLLSKIEACSDQKEGEAPCVHCQQTNSMRKRILDITIYYDDKMTRINKRLEKVVDGMRGEPVSVLGVSQRVS